MKLPMEYGSAEKQQPAPAKSSFAKRKRLPEDFVLHRNMRTESRTSEMKKERAEDDFDIEIPENDDFDLKIDFSERGSAVADKNWYER
ncbi:MAG: hypothetical protein K6F39_03165 [Lachnospiraceae bacterium]|nr:hypothetical protein [Lachnospiraceae bacterium]